MLQVNLSLVKVGRKEILHDIDISVKQGGCLAILGPNGSGKSTLLASITDSPVFKMIGTAQLAQPYFLGFQKPVEVPEIRTIDLLMYLSQTYSAVAKCTTPEGFYSSYGDLMQALQLAPEMLERPVNIGLSGGENKRTELLQMAVMCPHLVMFDEIDTGLDIDAIVLLGNFIKQWKEARKVTFVVVTHNLEFLKYFEPKKVIVLKDGTISVQGDRSLLGKIKASGFNKLTL